MKERIVKLTVVKRTKIYIFLKSEQKIRNNI